MKKVILIGGTMGVGKTTICQALKHQLNQSVFLDGDWCWDMHPFIVNDETKDMVMDNICYMLNNFIHCSEYQNIIFCWVMHEQTIVDEILSQLDINHCEVYHISLICSIDVLTKQIQHDIDLGIRKPDVLKRSIERMELYKQLHSIKIDKSQLSIDETVAKIMEIIC